MSRLDLVIFGATGFTGKNAVIECAKIAKKRNGLTWGIAGRSKAKLAAVLDEASKKTGDDLSSIPVLVADVGDEASLRAMCERTRVLVNCCGPYRLYGEPVVAAAVKAGANMVDVSGEPQYIETMQLKYSTAARDAGVYVISACGFDSIPNDLGVIFLEQNFDGTLNSVESYLSGSVAPAAAEAARKYGLLHHGTWESIIHGVRSRSELAPLRKKLYPDPLPSFKPKLQKRSVIHKRNGSWCLPFPGSDASIVYRTQRELYSSEKKRPVQFRVYTKFSSLMYALATIFAGGIFLLLTLCSVTRQWLIDNPRFFSFGVFTKDEVKEEVMENTFFSMELYGEGWDKGVDINTTSPNKKMVAKVSGVNPGYGATVVALLQSALTILDEREKMPQPGGVMTTGFAFKDTTIIKRLHENNLKFEIIEK
ncbi:saccharopine dehydrogenase-like oxidoreductase [Battus philenor]|uniref:saccharopine dehydrogenase-like oxidoreductase n=1 Tax=Battus philenor TaxID=42288 RepID=UPI0035CEE16C